MSEVSIWTQGDTFNLTWSDRQLDFSGVLPEGAEQRTTATGGSVRGIRSYAEAWAMLHSNEPAGYMWAVKG